MNVEGDTFSDFDSFLLIEDQLPVHYNIMKTICVIPVIVVKTVMSYCGLGS